MIPKVLFVDDDSQIVDLTLRWLDGFGYDARGLTDSREAADVVRSFNPDVCILDVNMPYVRGSDLLDKVKSINPHTEVILLTGMNDTVLAVEMMKRGAADFLLKPIESKQVDIAVSRALEHRRLVLENTAYKLHLEMLVEERSKALNNALSNLNDLHGATLETLAMALDLRDQGTSGHSRRVADMAIGIAKDVGMTNGDLVQIEHGALLHDIGKLRIPDSILWKPGELTLEEWQIMRRHPEYGHDFVTKIEFLNGAADIILSHHEKFDGSGYPRGLKRDEISLGTRIFSLVDAVDAMVHDRPYHRAMPFPSARKEILKHSGSHFDPDLIEPALAHLERYAKKPKAGFEDSGSQRSLVF